MAGHERRAVGSTDWLEPEVQPGVESVQLANSVALHPTKLSLREKKQLAKPVEERLLINQVANQAAQTGISPQAGG
jgi:hypothetical protein